MEKFDDNITDNYEYAKYKIGTAESVRIISDIITDKDLFGPESINRIIQSQIDYIADKLNFAIHMGQRCVTIPMIVRVEVRDILMKLGYQVDTFTYPDLTGNAFTQEFVWIGW